MGTDPVSVSMGTDLNAGDVSFGDRPFVFGDRHFIFGDRPYKVLQSEAGSIGDRYAEQNSAELAE